MTKTSKQELIDFLLRRKIKQESFNIDIQSEMEFERSIICGLIGFSPFDDDINNNGTQFILFRAYDTVNKDCMTVSEDYDAMEKTLRSWLADMPDTIYVQGDD